MKLKEQTADLEFETHVDTRSLTRKLDRVLLPPLTGLYLLSFLDRSNVGNARLEGLTTDLHMSGDQYLTSLMLYFIGYVLFEIPRNVVLKLWTPQLWPLTLTLCWGVVATLMGVTQSMAGFFIVRFFSGVAETGLFPGIEGLLTVVIASAYFFIHNYPSTARFLTDDERSLIHARLKAASDATNEGSFKWQNARKAFTDLKAYLYALGFRTMSLPLYTLSLFLPSIIRSLGYTAAQAQLLTIPPYALGFVWTLMLASLSKSYHRRAPFILRSSSLAIIGYIILLSDYRPGVSYLGTFFAATGTYGSVALVLAWPANNVSGQTKRAVANAMQISIGNLGAILGTQLYRVETAPRYYLGHGFALGSSVANLFVVSALWWVLSRENKKKDAVQEVPEGDWLGDDDPRWRFHL